MERDLRENLFDGLRKSIKDTFRYQYSDPRATYADLLVSARKAEAEEKGNGKGATASATSKAAEVVPTTSTAEQPITAKSLQEAISKALQEGKKTDNGNQRFGNRGFRRNPNKTQDGKTEQSNKNGEKDEKSNTEKKGPRDGRLPHCWNCKGLGHLSRNCPSPRFHLNGQRGEKKSPDQPPKTPQQN